ncbi:MAG: glucoamylase [bacterium]
MSTPKAAGERGRVNFGCATRLSPGERGEYEVAAGRLAGDLLRAVAAAGNAGGMIPEQVWDTRAPSGRPSFAPGEPTFSATPLVWSHAELVRLAWSIEAGRPVERPAIVACRCTGACASWGDGPRARGSARPARGRTGASGAAGERRR